MEEVLVSMERLNCTSSRSTMTFLKSGAASWVQGEMQGWHTILHNLGDYWDG